MGRTHLRGSRRGDWVNIQAQLCMQWLDLGCISMYMCIMHEVSGA